MKVRTITLTVAAALAGVIAGICLTTNHSQPVSPGFFVSADGDEAVAAVFESIFPPVLWRGVAVRDTAGATRTQSWFGCDRRWGADEIKILLGDKREFKARVVGTDPKTDVAAVTLCAASASLRPVRPPCAPKGAGILDLIPQI